VHLLVNVILIKNNHQYTDIFIFDDIANADYLQSYDIIPHEKNILRRIEFRYQKSENQKELVDKY